MLKEKNRIKKRKEFGYIHKHGDTSFGKNIIVLYTYNKFKKVRVGFSVSKKVGKAYVRNKIKRQLRAIVRLNLDKFHNSTNYVIIAKPSIVNQTYLQMEKELMQAISKVKKVETEC